MIVTVTPNVALDITYHVDGFRVGASHRVRRVTQRAGGKGVNVARVLHGRRRDVIVTGFVGGLTGQWVKEDLAAAGVKEALVTVKGETRRTCTVVSDAGQATAFNEPGPGVSPIEWDALVERVTVLLGRASAVVCSGSLPPNAPPDGYAELVGRARARGIPCIVDAAGEVLLRALTAQPDVVKPNAEELHSTTGVTGPVAAVASLRHAGAAAVVASFGARGLLAAAAEGAWRAEPSRAAIGNPTGAGDAAVAALAAGMADGNAWPERLRQAVALSAATVSTPVAGDIDDDAYRRLLHEVRVETVALPMRPGWTGRG